MSVSYAICTLLRIASTNKICESRIQLFCYILGIALPKLDVSSYILRVTHFMLLVLYDIMLRRTNVKIRIVS